jgi:hypothetical protein
MRISATSLLMVLLVFGAIEAVAIKKLGSSKPLLKNLIKRHASTSVISRHQFQPSGICSNINKLGYPGAFRAQSAPAAGSSNGNGVTVPWSYGNWIWKYRWNFSYDGDKDYRHYTSPEGFIQILRIVFSQGKKVWIWVERNDELPVRQIYGVNPTKENPDLSLDGPKVRYWIENYNRLDELFKFLQANFPDKELVNKFPVPENYQEVAKPQNPYDWIEGLRGILRGGRNAILTIYKGGEFCITEDPKPVPRGSRPSLTVIYDRRDNDHVQTYNWLFNYLQGNRDFSQYLPDESAQYEFNEDSNWYVDLLDFLKQRKQVEIEVDEEGQVFVFLSRRQNGSPGYTILTNIRTIQNQRSPQYYALFNLNNFIESHRNIIQQYITVTTTTVTTNTAQVSGGEAFLNKLAGLLGQNRQFTIVIDNNNTYQVNENRNKSGNSGFFTVEYSTSKPTSAQRTAWDNLYKLLKTRPTILRLDRTSQPVSDPFAAVIKTTSVTTTTTTTKRGN